METRAPKRIWLESGLATAASTLAILTLFWPEWLEGLTGTDPDHGSGAFEWLIVAGLALVALGAAVAARLEWRRFQASTSLQF